MKFKLDENLSPHTRDLFLAAGHEAETVIQERLGGASDIAVFDECVKEGRCLVTLDLDFADPVRFPPSTSAGIAVVRAPRRCSPAVLDRLITNLLNALAIERIAGRLWIVELGRIRVHEHLGHRS